MACEDGPWRRFGVSGVVRAAAIRFVAAHHRTGTQRCRSTIVRVLALAFILIQHPALAFEHQSSARHPSAVHHLPPFITSPGETDLLLVVMALVLIGVVLAFGVFFLWLHNLPERLMHNSTKVHFDIVASLALISLLTHIHLFWVLALLIALVKVPIPDFTGLLGRIAGSLEKMADTTPARSAGDGSPEP